MTPTTTGQVSDDVLGADLARVHSLRIGGAAVAAEQSYDLLSPVDGSRIAQIGLADEAQVDAAVRSAADAALAWAGTAPATRSGLLRAWAALISEHKQELAELASREMGKIMSECLGEIQRALAEIDYAAGEAARLTGSTYPSATPGVLVYTTREPLGVVGAITPWNFPVVAPVRKIAPALAYGNAVVLKPANQTPLCALALADLLTQAGAPAGLLNVVTGTGRTGAALVSHPSVAGVSFTGSTAVGRSIAATAGERLVPVQLELGGKNAVYVDASADLERAVPEIASAALQASGQRCTAISRVLAHRDIADALVSELAAAFDAAALGAPDEPGVDIGPLVTPQHAASVREHVERAVQAGAVPATRREPRTDAGFVTPVVLDQVTRTMDVARSEVFGPVLSVLRVADLDEAIDVANEAEYGLAAVVFADSLESSLAFVRGARAGMVHVNHGTASQPHVPFGGVGASGLGAYSIGETGAEFFTQLKVAYVKP
ncbi:MULTISPECIES: aldehyde dehydrogenase family protein [unclassified Nocardioides]|uniref:aldehyde dehydrogenase family protein n=1 Tax=unclassified Nocardioides TaxID=2615069 RepID=UPI0009EFEFD3|nr:MULTISPECIES: aldehyde dehydrogenase family protein [unclassified Nocardioides]GAW51835.1 Aldehyde dehydrogenase [Nocardioides sp. PD653-B2]GAW53511.1 Aldehyde dehydrogenase [Nocardioides sp. PD653]